MASSTKAVPAFWLQAFEHLSVAKGIERIVVSANEENLGRLSVEVLKSI